MQGGLKYIRIKEYGLVDKEGDNVKVATAGFNLEQSKQNFIKIRNSFYQIRQ
ncbi:MAG: hypothetical protein AAB221_13430 [Bacteroidota bacterium]